MNFLGGQNDCPPSQYECKGECINDDENCDEDEQIDIDKLNTVDLIIEYINKNKIKDNEKKRLEIVVKKVLMNDVVKLLELLRNNKINYEMFFNKINVFKMLIININENSNKNSNKNSISKKTTNNNNIRNVRQAPRKSNWKKNKWLIKTQKK